MSYTAACDHDYAPRFGGPRPMIVTLCGSTRFKEEFQNANGVETLHGNIVLAPGIFGHADGYEVPAPAKEKLDELHKRKIDMADEVIIVSDRTGYIGDSTRSEIAYAEAAGKPIRWWCDHCRRPEHADGTTHPLPESHPAYHVFYDSAVAEGAGSNSVSAPA